MGCDTGLKPRKKAQPKKMKILIKNQSRKNQ
jgi:hypothetical protein